MDRVIRQLVSVLAVYAAIGFLALGTGVSASAATLTTSVTACDSPASVAQVSANGARLAALTGPVREGSSPTVGTSAGRSDFAVAAETAGAGGSDWAELSGVLRDASAGKGNFGLGAATEEQAGAAGQAWVGDGFRVASDGKTLVSQDGLRAFRPPSFKPQLGKYQANFESWDAGQVTGRPLGNGHLDIPKLLPR